MAVKSIKSKTLFKNRQTGGGGPVLQPNQRDLTSAEAAVHAVLGYAVLTACICKPLHLHPQDKPTEKATWYE